MALNTISSAEFTSGVLVADTTRPPAGGSPDAITARLTPGAAFDIQSTQGTFIVPRMTNDQFTDIEVDPGISSGMIYYDTDYELLFSVQNGGLSSSDPSYLRFARDLSGSSYTLLLNDYVFGVNTTSQAFTIRLPDLELFFIPSPAIITKHYYVKDLSGNASVHNITIETTDGTTINGDPTYVVDVDYGSVHLFTDGQQWYTL